MEPAHSHVDLLYARDRLRLADRVDQPSMPARGDYDEPAVLDVEARRMLAPMVVEHELARALLRGEVRGVAAGAVAHADLDLGVRDHPLERRTSDRAGGEAMPRDCGGLICGRFPHPRRGPGATSAG